MNSNKKKLGCGTSILWVICIIVFLWIFKPLRFFVGVDNGTNSITPVGIDKTTSQSTSNNAVLPTTTVYSDNGITITIKNLNGTKSFDYEIENNRDDDITYMVEGVAINNCMVYDLIFSQPITSGNKAVEKYDISGAKDYGISTVETIDLYLSIYDTSINEIAEPLCHAETSEYTGVQYDYSHNAKLFYEDNILTASIETTGSRVNDFNAVYYNKTDEVLYVSVDDEAINGVMLSSPVLSPGYILPHSYAYTGSSNGTITLWSALDDEIEEKGLEPVGSITGKLYISGNGHYTTDTITIFE